MMYSSYRAVQAQEEDETYLMEDNHQSATIPVHHRQQTIQIMKKNIERGGQKAILCFTKPLIIMQCCVADDLLSTQPLHLCVKSLYSEMHE